MFLTVEETDTTSWREKLFSMVLNDLSKAEIDPENVETISFQFVRPQRALIRFHLSLWSI